MSSPATSQVLNEATGSNGAANYGANAVVPAIPKAAPADRGQQGKTPVENPEAEERLEASEEEEQVVHRKQKAKGNLGGKHGQRQVQMEEEDSEDEGESVSCQATANHFLAREEHGLPAEELGLRLASESLSWIVHVERRPREAFLT